MMSQQIGDYCISRQVVLDILEKEGHKWGNDYRDWVDAIAEIKKLPPKDRSVQDFVDKCRECGREKVLDKIRAEIGHIGKATPLIGINTVIEIIDKYKAESEEV